MPHRIGAATPKAQATRRALLTLALAGGAGTIGAAAGALSGLSPVSCAIAGLGAGLALSAWPLPGAGRGDARLAPAWRAAGVETPPDDASPEALARAVAERVEALERQNAGLRDELAEGVRRFEAAESRRADAAAAREAVVARLGAVIAEVGAGDLTVRIAEPFPEAYEPLRANLNSALVTLSASMLLVRRNAGEMTRMLDGIAGGVREVAGQSAAQSALISRTTTQIADLSAAVRTTAQSVSEASESVAFARSEAENSQEVVDQTVGAMNQIVDAANSVSDVAGVIDNIAFQTNLLALNAAVEAARAGEAGRGFAVVASEVRALAQRTAEHAQDIKRKIERTNDDVERGRALVMRTGDTLSTLAGQVGELADFVFDIASTTRKQAETLGDVRLAADDVNANGRAAAEATQGCLDQIVDVRDRSEDLVELVGQFGLGEGRALAAE
jgi:methyl-accepting chemotaxis protein